MQSNINSICVALLNNQKIKKIDIYTVYRAITQKKNRLNVPVELFDLDEFVTHAELFDFIKIINPFFDEKNQKKIDQYRTYYLICKKIVYECNVLLAEQNKPAYFKVYDCDSKKCLTYKELNCDSVSESRYEAQFSCQQETDKVIVNYMKLFNFLQIEKNLDILTFNSQHKIIDSDKFN